MPGKHDDPDAEYDDDLGDDDYDDEDDDEEDDDLDDYDDDDDDDDFDDFDEGYNGNGDLRGGSGEELAEVQHEYIH